MLPVKIQDSETSVAGPSLKCPGHFAQAGGEEAGPAGGEADGMREGGGEEPVGEGEGQRSSPGEAEGAVGGSAAEKLVLRELQVGVAQERDGEGAGVGDGQVGPLTAGRGDGMGGIADQRRAGMDIARGVSIFELNVNKVLQEDSPAQYLVQTRIGLGKLLQSAPERCFVLKGPRPDHDNSRASSVRMRNSSANQDPAYPPPRIEPEMHSRIGEPRRPGKSEREHVGIHPLRCEGYAALPAHE